MIVPFLRDIIISYQRKKGLPNLIPTDIKENYVPYLPSNTGGAKRGQKATIKSITQKESSKTKAKTKANSS